MKLLPGTLPPGDTLPPLSSGSEQPATGRGLTLVDVTRILSARRWIILAMAAAGLLAAIVISLLMTPLFRASALLELNSATKEVINQASGSGDGRDRGSTGEIVTTQMGLIRSETLAQRVVQELNLASNPRFGGVEGTRAQRVNSAVGTVLANTLVDNPGESLLIAVSYSSPDPALAARVANGLAEGYIASSLERRYDSSSYARNFLSEQLAQTKRALEQSERDLNRYGIESGIFRTPGQVVDGQVSEGPTISATNLAALNEAYNNVQIRRIEAEQAYRNSTGGNASSSDSPLSGLVQQRTTLQANYDEKAKIFKADYPEMQQIAAQIARLDTTIASERGRTSSGAKTALLGDFRAARAAENELASRVAAAKGDIQSEKTRSIQYNILQRETDTNRALYDALLQRYKEIGVAGGIGQSNVSIVDRAVPPDGPYRPNLPVNAALGLLLGLALGVGVAFAVHLLFDTIADASDVREKLRLPVLGVVPRDGEDRTLMEALADRKSDVFEAYLSVRTALRFARPEGLPRSLLLTSSRPGEGKSTSAFAIASSMARAGSRVLLIDADLRKPTFVSQTPDGLGFAHLLSHEVPLDNLVEGTQMEQLTLLPVGRFSGSAGELLGSPRLRLLIREAQEAYDLVVIDGPPVLGLADAPSLGAAAEATIFIIEAGQSRTGPVLEVLRRMRDAGATVLGAIVTKVSRKNGGYGYYYYSYGDEGGQVGSDEERRFNLHNAA